MSEEEPPTHDNKIVTARITATDVVRLDQIASRRGIERSEVIAEAIDEFLAHEGLSGRFIAPPPPMRIPRRDRDLTRGRRQSRLRHR
jgi:hypothetical protein